MCYIGPYNIDSVLYWYWSFSCSLVCYHFRDASNVSCAGFGGTVMSEDPGKDSYKYFKEACSFKG